mgnify:CR=1 FL=1
MRVLLVEDEPYMADAIRDGLRLEAIAAHMCAAEEVSAAEFMQTIKEINMAEKYYTPEQMEAIKQRGQQLGEERIRQVEAEWPELIAQVRAAIDQGADPASPAAQCERDHGAHGVAVHSRVVP